MQDLLTIALEARIEMPMSALALTLLVLAVCLLFRCNFGGLLVAYVLAFYIVWDFYRTDVLPKVPDSEVYGIFFLIFGAAVPCLAVVGSFVRSSED